MVFKNVQMDGEKIRISRPLNYLKATIYTVVAWVLIYLLADELRVGYEAFWLEVCFIGLIFLVWLWLFARQKAVTTFDPESRLVTRRNLLWPLRSMTFDQVGTVELVNLQETCGGNGEFLSLTPRGNRFGKGVTLTKVYAGADPELVYIRAVVVPALDAMLGAERAEADTDTDTDTGGAAAGNQVYSLPEAPRFYTKRGGVYRRLTLRTLFFPFLITVGFLIWAALDWNQISAGIGGLFLVVTLLLPFKVELDSDLREVRQYKYFGLRVNRRISFDAYKDVLTIREHQNGFYIGTRMEMRFHGVEWTIPLTRVFFTGNLEKLLKETENIVLAGHGIDGDGR